jgi:hypothetical protein
MVDYSGVKSYLENNNPQYFTFSLNSEKTIKAVIRHLSPVEDISNNLKNLVFNVINVRHCRPIENHRTDKPTWKTSSYSLLP